jgi:DNA-binding Xre family transcriptional regulator
MATIKIRLHELLEEKMKRDGRDPIHNPITQEEVAHAAGVSRPTVATYMKNRLNRLDIEILVKFCEYLDCDVSDLLVLEK